MGTTGSARTAHARLDLAPDLTSPRRARTFLAMLLDEWGLTHLDDMALLLASELVTNAVLHTRATSILSARVDDGTLEVRVVDTAAAFPELRHPQPEDEAGRGLMLVNTYADSWGVEPLAHEGKAVWFKLTC